MAKQQLAKYRIDADDPGMHIAGAGVTFGVAFGTNCGIVKPGTVLELPVGALDEQGGVRACMTPLNDVAEKEFERKRDRVEKAWRASLAKGCNPDGQPLEHKPDDIEAFVKSEVEKVGPRKREFQRVGKKRAPFAPSSLSVSASPEEPKIVPEEESGDALLAPVPKPGKAVRASDA